MKQNKNNPRYSTRLNHSLLAVMLFLIAMPLQAQVIRRFNFNNAAISGSPLYVITEGSYSMQKSYGGQEAPNTNPPFFTNITPSGTGKSLALTCEATTQAKHRNEYQLSPATNSHPFNSYRWVGYQFKIDDRSGRPLGWTILTQFHQDAHGSSPTAV